MEFRQPDEADRERSYDAIRSVTEGLDAVRPGAIETAAFLLAEAKTSFERTAADSANLESKATAALGIVAGATSVLGVFGTRDGKPIIATPIVTAAMCCVLVALVCLLYMLRAKRLESPDIGSYVSAAMVREDNRLGLTLTVAETYLYMRDRFGRTLRQDGRALFLAYMAIAAASISLLVNAVSANRGIPAQIGSSLKAGTPAPATKSSIP